MGWFRKLSRSEPLSVTMAGVRMGDRLLAIGGADPVLLAALAAKTGLTGEARIVEADADRARQTGAAVERHGALADVTTAPWSMLPYDTGSFDIAIGADFQAVVPPEAQPRCAAEVFRVLRPGGRFMIIESRSRAASGDATTSMMQAAGFAAVRVLAEREGIRYVEGMKRGA